ncbi:hypothetical protein [Flavobacterium sp.]|uniref:hypothetical protein n=1 Tax=Flavobacterium sp. TaxID=239 RepID=UPI003C45D59F
MEAQNQQKETMLTRNHPAHGLRDLFKTGLKEIYYAEKDYSETETLVWYATLE